MPLDCERMRLRGVFCEYSNFKAEVGIMHGAGRSPAVGERSEPQRRHRASGGGAQGEE